MQLLGGITQQQYKTMAVKTKSDIPVLQRGGQRLVMPGPDHPPPN